MKIQDFLKRHGICKNPFAEEDAQTDPVFKDHCIDSTYHPTWDKIYGNPEEPATAIVFGEKGAGKTAMRLQIAKHVEEFNRQHQGSRLFVIHYDDFNPFLDHFRQKLPKRRQRVDRVLQEWKLWDHMDSILSTGVTGLVDRILETPFTHQKTPCPVDATVLSRLDRHQARDLLLLAACYDQSSAETVLGRWLRLKRQVRFRTFGVLVPWVGGLLGTFAVMALLTLALIQQWQWLQQAWIYVVLLALGWTPWLWRLLRCHRYARSIVRHVRTGKLDTASLRKILMYFRSSELSAQPLPMRERTDDRYELLAKFEGVLATFGFSGMIVLIDRLDEPHLINGSAELMKSLLWPMLDNKFLKQSGLGLKMMLPIELIPYVDREQNEFFQRARLDKQNLVRSLEWSGEALYDVANARLRACVQNGSAPKLLDLFDDTIDEQHLIDRLRSLRVPRHLFKFLYRLLVAHSTAHTDENPVWKISSDTFESVLAVFNRDQDAWDRGLSAG